MGHFTYNGHLKGFTPDDGPDHFYIDADTAPSLNEIILRAEEKWGLEFNDSNITIEAEHINTRCLGYGRYDPGDHDNFLKISITR